MDNRDQPSPSQPRPVRAPGFLDALAADVAEPDASAPAPDAGDAATDPIRTADTTKTTVARARARDRRWQRAFDGWLAGRMRTHARRRPGVAGQSSRL